MGRCLKRDRPIRTMRMCSDGPMHIGSRHPNAVRMGIDVDCPAHERDNGRVMDRLVCTVIDS
eukprot:359469-Chlamydomonas_euryale.AAC.17